MQDQNTPAEAGTPAPARGRHILTAVLDGTSDAISAFMGRFSMVASSAQVDIAGVESLGPLPADHPAQQLPTIPPMDSAAPGVLLDLHPDQEPVQLQPDSLSSTPADATAQPSAEGPADDGSREPDQGGTVAGVVPPNQNAGDEANEGADHSAADSASVDGSSGVALPSISTPVEVGAVVADQGSSGQGSLEVSAAAEPPSAAQILAAIDAGKKLLILNGDTASALVLAFLGHAAAEMDPTFDPVTLNSALVAAIGALDQVGDSASGDVISKFGAQLFPQSWKLPLTFDPPAPSPDSPVSSQPVPVAATGSAAAPSAEVTAPIGSPVEGAAVQPVDPSPHPDPVSVNPNAR